ncbi:hypothetical protein [Phocaeicola coprocola]|uniref:hypothetical protein n=1 Tax=Phocaeicola coprocola TaxID=310298 RepID=UPI0039F4DE99
MANMGYFESASVNLKTGVDTQVKGISEGIKANYAAGVSLSVNALDTRLKAATALGSLADNVSEAAVLHLLCLLGKGKARQSISKQLAVVIGADIYLTADA